MKRVLAIILGGGAGSRLYPLTKERAKPAVPLAGKYRLIDIPVSNCINSDITKIYVLTQFKSASLNRHISRAYNFVGFRDEFVEVLAAQKTEEDSTWFQGTADAVRQYMHLIETWKDIDEVLILSGDHLYRMDYRNFIHHHRQTGADITLSVIPIDDERASSFGLMKIDAQGKVIDFHEKPTGDRLQQMRVDTTTLGLSAQDAQIKPYIASMGIYVFKKDVLLDLLKTSPESTDFGKEIIPNAIFRQGGSNLKVQAHLFNDYWEDIGTIKSFFDANLGLTSQPDPAFSFYDEKAPIYTRSRYLPPTKLLDCRVTESIIGEGCILKKCDILHSVLGVRSWIEEGCVIDNALLLGSDYSQTHRNRYLEPESSLPIGIGKNSVVRRAIIDKNVRIGQNVKIINEKGLEDFDDPQGRFYIRNGIVVIPKNTEIPDGTII
ncbi:glucose-1-phosphate adenylyltransferase [Lyngbya confervoides]|uniref:Glucose-1-phosphate adenylyltransferase n=1 Tax=Lyngbya confervoides BDU141951 TaxID=1574623 RepID=A0ABD4T5P9_9CYAN|nr:glucose-1-phosphate adenylyltransferase [Lyngbya confervoides]MCM1983577.1 glucose-1-phosphate adenylyltransferase [Lyngbya confervoides BDU141951]